MSSGTVNVTSTRSPVLMPSSASMSRKLPGCTSSGGSPLTSEPDLFNCLTGCCLADGDRDGERLFGEIRVCARDGKGVWLAGAAALGERDRPVGKRAVTPVDGGVEVGRRAVVVEIGERGDALW